jgi:hypothetical protein
LYNFVHAKESFKGQCQKSTKSIISHPFLKHFHRNISIYKITTPSNRVEGVPSNFFSSNPIPAKAKKLGLLSIYKFSLVVLIADVVEAVPIPATVMVGFVQPYGVQPYIGGLLSGPHRQTTHSHVAPAHILRQLELGNKLLMGHVSCFQ